MRLTWLGTVLVAISFTCIHAARAEVYPARPVRFIVPFPPGGANDTIARLLAEPLTEMLGQQFVIDNRGGANTIIGTSIVAKASPDGYTILIVPGSFAINASLYRKLPYDSRRDFVPVAMIGNGAYVVVVHPSLPVKSAAELIALAKRRPGEIRYASSGVGNVTHVAAALFNMMAGTEMLHVPYKGGGPVMIDLLAGRVSVFFSTVSTAIPQIKAGKLRVIGATTAQPSAALPDVPPVAQTGLPGYEVSGWYGILAPAGTPKAAIGRLNQAVRAVLRQPELKRQLLARGVETVDMTPEQFGGVLHAEFEKWGKVIKALNITAD
ncbi:MAG: tripartite tricarboxylate transporter substrate binding protein [Betaproteobacteria bacterium]|nr:tripartite tricarboxylate transporter substrate binding protein [Betaproteobacteria bacterium]